MSHLRTVAKAIATLTIAACLTIMSTAAALAARPDPPYLDPQEQVPLKPVNAAVVPGFFDSGLWRGLLVAAAVLVVIGATAAVIAARQRHPRLVSGATAE